MTLAATSAIRNLVLRNDREVDARERWTTRPQETAVSRPASWRCGAYLTWATPDHRARREAFVEGVLVAFPPFPFDLLVARAHARLRAGLASSGIDMEAHDRLLAATAITAGWCVGTANVKHFERIPELDVLAITWRTEA